MTFSEKKHRHINPAAIFGCARVNKPFICCPAAKPPPPPQKKNNTTNCGYRHARKVRNNFANLGSVAKVSVPVQYLIP